jgi:hypothetical protein
VKVSFASLGSESQLDGRKLRRRAIGQDVKGFFRRQTFSDSKETRSPAQTKRYTLAERKSERCFAATSLYETCTFVNALKALSRDE